MKKLILTLAVVLGLSAASFGLAPQTALADAKSEVCKGAGVNGSCGTGGVSLDNIVKNIVQLFAVIIGVAAVIMIMMGGFKYITSGGDAGKVASAKSTLLYAIIGLVVAFMAQAIVSFVLTKATK